MTELKDRIKQIRKTAKLTQQGFAKEIGIGWETVAGWEQGKIKPGHARLYIIAENFGVNIDWLLKGEGLPYKKDIEQAAQNIEDIEVIKRLFHALPTDFQDKILTAIREMIATGAVELR